MALAQKYQATAALLAARSPSYGTGRIYNGAFQRQLTEGDGVTVALLQRHGIQCFSPDDHAQLSEWMNHPINLRKGRLFARAYVATPAKPASLPHFALLL